MLWWYYSIPVSNAGPSVDISYSSSGPTVYFHSSLFSLNREGSAIIYFTFIDPFKEGIYFFYWSICCSLLHILILILIMIRFLHDVIPTKICNEFRFSIDPIITTAASSTTPPVTDTATDPDDGFYQQLRIGRAVLWYILFASNYCTNKKWSVLFYLCFHYFCYESSWSSSVYRREKVVLILLLLSV